MCSQFDWYKEVIVLRPMIIILTSYYGTATFYWLLWLGINHFSYLFISIILYNNDLLGYFLLIFVLILSHPHMMYLLFKDNGVSQNMSKYHWITYIVWIIYAIYRLNNMIYNDKQKLLFIYTFITLITNILVVILDWWGIINWYYLQNQYILRSQFVLKYLKKHKLIGIDIQRVQWIKKKGKKIC